MKTIYLTIGEEYNNYSLIKYLKIVQPNWTKVFAMKMVRTGNVLINKKKTTINYRLKVGDKLELYGYSTNETQLENLNLDKLKSLNVVYEDTDVIIVNKEIGIPVQADEKNLFNNMNNRLLKHTKWNLKESTNKWKPVFIHRLDRNTTGLLIGAKTYKAYLDLNKAMKERKIEKYYITKVNGLVPFKNKLIKNYLLKKSKENKVLVVSSETKGAKEAISEVKLIKHLLDKKESLLEVKLITGRTHQIRVHLSSIGFPIRGDQKYGVEKEKKLYSYPVLKAYKLVFDKEIEGSSLNRLKGRSFILESFLSDHEGL